MSITASGGFLLTFEKMFIDTAAQSLEAETHKGLLLKDTFTPDFDAHDFRADIGSTNESTGTGYTLGGATITGTALDPGGVVSGRLDWDFDDPSWTTSTITDAMAHMPYFNVGSTDTDQLICIQDFVTAVSTVAGTLTVQLSTGGAFQLDLTP